ncbi:MAG: M28 family peptidase, partial [Candidatus Thorarchaeota archaeon]
EEIWSAKSIDNIGNYTRDLCEDYPSRIWDEGPSQNLIDAWAWANATLKTNTQNELAFSQVTEYQSLLAIKEGTGPSPRPAFALSGIIDSETTPGANDAGASVAAVLELARLLHNYSLAYDVYYVLLNGVHLDEDIDYGGRAFVQWLDENEIDTFSGIAFDRILFHRSGYLYGLKISIRSDSQEGLFHDELWIPDFLVQYSSNYGNGFIQRVMDLEIAERSLAHEMWMVGRPAMHISQGYIYDPISSTANDLWSNPDFSFAKAAELVASTAAVVAYIGFLGTGVAAERYRSDVLQVDESAVVRTTVTTVGYLNATISWDADTTINAVIFNPTSGQVLYQRTEDDGVIVMKYLVLSYGSYSFNVTNVGSNPTNYSLIITALEDADGDTLFDPVEVSLGISPYLRDSDRDGLDDDFELELGTNPASSDSDGDGASDLNEFTWGSSLVSNDTDNDGIGDGTEAELGTNPISADTDSDGLDDYLEVYVIGTDPLSDDSDRDGLEDGFEYEMGLNPLSPDTDEDSLSDLFEILNLLSPFTSDTDADGWSDAYEVEYCMSPTSADTDQDGIPDGIDWDPREHWITVVSPVTLLSVIMLLMSYSFFKLRIYKRPD